MCVCRVYSFATYGKQNYSFCSVLSCLLKCIDGKYKQIKPYCETVTSLITHHCKHMQALYILGIDHSDRVCYALILCL